MANYLKLFETHSQYEAYMGGGEIALPNVSHCISENEVHYNPYVHDYSQDYFTTIAKESGTITFTYISDAPTGTFTSMSYKKNDGEWITTQYDPNNGNTIDVSVNNGDKVQWKGINNVFYYYDESSDVESDGYFTSTHTVDVEGNIMSLLYGDNFSDKRSLEGREGAFAGLFSYDDNLQIISAENLVLPATTLASSCYVSMFNGCTSLTTAPELPATTLANNCYQYMFYGCTSLTTAPELPATTLANNCYDSMFYDCTSLTTAPDLPATTLADYCYANMFYGCSSLTTPPELPATTLAEGCYNSMFQGCTSLTTAPELPATTLANYCYRYMFSGCTSLTTALELHATTLAQECCVSMFAGCTSLTTAPGLPATTLVRYCYSNMFEGCTSLVTAPELPATTLANNCYQYMFYNCTSLNYIKAMFTTTPSTSYTAYWVSGVASTGTFVKNSAAAWNVTGVNGIPSGWTVQTASA